MAAKKKPSRGSVAFASLMPKHGDQKRMAARLGAAQDDVSRWASGGRSPSVTWRVKLQETYGIAVLAWDEPVVENDAVKPTGTEG